MKPSTDLFQLIKSLTPAEKKHFRRQVEFNNKDRKSNGLLLFDAINKMMEYDEAVLKEQLPEKMGKNLSTEKVHLYNLIHRSLRSYHSSKKLEIKIRSLISDVEILSDKALYKLAHNRLKQAWKLAEKFEFFHFQLELLSLKRRIELRLGIYNNKNAVITLNNEQRDIIQKMENIHTYLAAYDRVLIVKMESTRSKSTHDDFQEINGLLKKLLQSPQNAITAESKLLFYSIKSYYQDFIPQKATQSFASKEIYDVYKSHPFLKEKLNQYYLSALHLYINSLIISNDTSEVPYLIQEFSKVKTNNLHEEIKQKQILLFLKSNLLIRTAQFELYSKFLDQYDNFIDTHFSSTQSIIRIMHKADTARFLFQQKKYEESIERLFQVINVPKTILAQDIQISMRLIMLIIYYEKDEIEILPYLYRSVHRYVYKNNFTGKFDKLVLRCLRELSKIPDQKSTKELYQKYFDEIDNLSEELGLYSIYGLLEIRLWLKSKVTGRSMEDLIREDSPDPPADLHLIFDEGELEVKA